MPEDWKQVVLKSLKVFVVGIGCVEFSLRAFVIVEGGFLLQIEARGS